MTDRTIPFHNVILRCDQYTATPVLLPEGFCVVSYQKGYEKDWAGMEYSIGDFNSTQEAEDYFMSTYLSKESNHENCRFLLSPDKKVIGSCIAWNDFRNDTPVSSLHWLAVDENYQGMGLGKALCLATMNIFAEKGGTPVYIHTEPWSWKAILLYLSIGFRLQKTDTFSHYENQYDNAMETLKGVVSEQQYERMQQASE